MAIKATTRNLKKQLKTVLTKEIVKFYGKAFENRIEAAFNKIKKEMVQEFLNHPVTVEIKNGPHAENTSGTLEGYGNLFSFIGFYEGDNPTDVIEGLLNLSDIKFSKQTGDGFLVTIYLPTKEQIFAETPFEWAKGRSWAEGIERGISGFGQYLNTEAIKSNSGTGIQIETQVRKGKFKNTSYISALLKKYTKKFQQLNKSIVISGIL
ncbi:MAG: hypothetical protein RLZZ181_103 [Pseudomonadota bacterium]|jgi:hypothetical protein